MWRPPVTPPLHPHTWRRPPGNTEHRVTSPFDHPRSYGPHGALDIGNARAGGDVLAAADGTVLAVGNLLAPWSVPGPFASGNYGGLMVVLDHPGHRSVYAHLADEYVTVGQRVRAGTRLGVIGDSGSAKGQPHLHFEIYAGTRLIDPWPLISAKEINVELREVYEPWTLPVGAKVWTAGPGAGREETVTVAEHGYSLLESVDNKWRVYRLEDGRIVWTRRIIGSKTAIIPKRRGGVPEYDRAVKSVLEVGRAL